MKKKKMKLNFRFKKKMHPCEAGFLDGELFGVFGELQTMRIESKIWNVYGAVLMRNNPKLEEKIAKKASKNIQAHVAARMCALLRYSYIVE